MNATSSDDVTLHLQADPAAPPRHQLRSCPGLWQRTVKDRRAGGSMICAISEGRRENCCSPARHRAPVRAPPGLLTSRGDRPTWVTPALGSCLPLSRLIVLAAPAWPRRRISKPRGQHITTPSAIPRRKKNQIMIKFLRSLGITSDVAYLAGMLSIGASIAAWTASSRMENAPGDKADRWGIYVGLWAPPSWPSATPSRPTK